MKDLQRFGNLLNEQDNPILIKDFEKIAIPQRKYRADNVQLYMYEDILAVATLNKGKITRYTLLGNRDEYKTMYSGSRATEDIFRQALWHGACILTRRAGNTIGLDYNL